MQFWKYIRVLFSKSPKVINWVIDIQKKIAKNFLGICNMQFRERSQKKFSQPPESFSLKVWKIRKKFFLFKALFLSKSSVGQLKTKFGKYAAIFFYKTQNALGQGPNIYRKDIGFSKKCSSSKERFFGNVKCSFDTPHETFWTKTSRILAVSPKVMDKTSMSGKYFFFSKTILRAHWKQFWQTLRIVFAKSPI